MTLETRVPRRARLALSALALFGGATIYIGGRSPSLLMFAWAEAIGLDVVFQRTRELVGPELAAAPEWMIDSLPFGLWLFALMAAVGRSPWLVVGPILGIGAELGQLTGTVPGTFDPIDLLVLLACAGAGAAIGLPQLGASSERPASRSARHLGPAFASLAFVLFATGTSEDPKAKAEREAKEAEAKEGFEPYMAGLATIHENLSALDKFALQEQACDVAKIHENGRVEFGAASLLSVHLPFLARFGEDKSLWTANEGTWDFLTDSTFAGHFTEHPDERESYAVKDTAQRVQETFLPARYVIVVAETSPDGLVAPKMAKDHFEGGFFDGWIFIVDQTDAKVACQYHIRAENSDEIDYGGLFDGNDAEKEMLEDFEDNLEDAIEEALPEGIELSTGYGAILQ